MIINRRPTENKSEIESISSEEFKEFLAKNNIQWSGLVVTQFHTSTMPTTIKSIIEDEECSLCLNFKNTDGLFKVVINEKVLIFRSEGYFKPYVERIVIDLSKEWKNFIKNLNQENSQENTL